MEKAKTFEQMLKAYKAIRKQVMDAKLDDITCVEMNEYNDPSRNHSWININVHFGKGGDFVKDQCTLVCINDTRFKQGMEDFKAALAERINQPNN
jgi:hypothetical protein